MRSRGFLQLFAVRSDDTGAELLCTDYRASPSCSVWHFKIKSQRVRIETCWGDTLIHYFILEKVS